MNPTNKIRNSRGEIAPQYQREINEIRKKESGETRKCFTVPPQIITGGGYTVDTVITSTDVFGEKSNFVPLTKFGKVIPEFYATAEGGIYDAKRSRWCPQKRQFENDSRGTRMSVNIRLPSRDFLSDVNGGYTYTTKTLVMTPVHRLIKESLEPIDLYPPDRLAPEWDQVITADMVGQKRIPEAYKQWVRDTALVDHIDDDATNNHITNLRYETPIVNCRFRKGQSNITEHLS